MKKLISILAIFSMLFCCSAMSCSFAAEPATKKTATTQVSKLKKAGAAAAATTAAAVVTACVAWGCSNKEVPEVPEVPAEPKSFWSKVSDHSGLITEVTRDIIFAAATFCAWYFGRQGEPGQDGNDAQVNQGNVLLALGQDATERARALGFVVGVAGGNADVLHVQ